MAEANKASAIVSALNFHQQPYQSKLRKSYIRNLFRNDVFDLLKACATGLYRPRTVIPSVYNSRGLIHR